jgi:NAD(P)H-flavin reductase
MVFMLEQPMTAGAATDALLPMPYRIQRVWRDTKDTFTLDLTPVDSGGGSSFVPGQFNMLYVFGVGEIPISISSDPSHSPAIRHTTRAVGAVSKAMGKLKRGEVIGVRGPFGSHWPIQEAAGRDVVIVAGGIGLAPLRSALYEIMSSRNQYGRVTVLYGARAPEDILFQRELELWRGKFDVDVQFTVDRAPSGWRGTVGVVTSLIGRAQFDPATTLAMICGPEVMMRFTVMEIRKRGVAANEIYLSMERNMKCAVGFCGHCQYGPFFICKDGPVFRLDRIASIFGLAEI